MTYFLSSVQGRLQHAFSENSMALTVQSDHIVAEDSQDCSKKKFKESLNQLAFVL